MKCLPQRAQKENCRIFRGKVLLPQISQIAQIHAFFWINKERSVREKNHLLDGAMLFPLVKKFVANPQIDDVTFAFLANDLRDLCGLHFYSESTE